MLAGFLQAVLAVAAVAGLLWLLGLLALDWLRFREPPLPHVGRVPLPTLLLVGRRAGRAAAGAAGPPAGRGRRPGGGPGWPGGGSGDRVERVAEERVLAPIEAELARARAAVCGRRAAVASTAVDT